MPDSDYLHLDAAYRCNRCGAIVFQYQIVYGSHGCRKCDSRRLEPISQDLTKLGAWYCDLRNTLGTWYYRRNKSKDIAF